MSQFIEDNFISHLKDIVLFEGTTISEDSLKKGRFNGKSVGNV